MTVTYKEPLTDNLSIKEMAMYDSKEKVRKIADIDFAKINGDLDTTEMYLALIRGVVLMK